MGFSALGFFVCVGMFLSISFVSYHLSIFGSSFVCLLVITLERLVGICRACFVLFCVGLCSMKSLLHNNELKVGALHCMSALILFTVRQLL